ncbi:hypothetical protein BE21_25100 [Sorangium cellulosum]|uniref:Uncharacterized protein n=1 Tax=Sorangium cellulosum TaxID=56 RepID=A0A150TU09_SORCE|nr:hypothetical protein BE21_25100 [Sorangium cellulosum]
MNTATRIASTRIPARRAASALPPTAKTYRPNRVRRSTRSNPITNPSSKSSASGTPRSALSSPTIAGTKTTTTASRAAIAPREGSGSPASARRRQVTAWPTIAIPTQSAPSAHPSPGERNVPASPEIGGS